MIDLFSYQDFRNYLKDKYTELKECDPKMNYRAMAVKVGFKSAGFFHKHYQRQTQYFFRNSKSIRRVL